MKIEHSQTKSTPKMPFLTIHIEQQPNGSFAITPIGNLTGEQAVYCLELFLKQIKDSKPKLIINE